MRVLAVDPGRQKCGLAVCGPEGIVAHRVVPPEDLAAVAEEWTGAHRVDVIVVGNSTGSQAAVALLSRLPVPVRTIEERGTTLAARRRYFQEHPPRGWRRLIPRSLRVPSEPYDDYAAILLAEAYVVSCADPGGR